MMNSDTALTLIDEIAKVSGNIKITMLSMNPGICKYLLAAYDPHTRYYATKVKPGEGDTQFDDLTWVLLKRLSTREISGDNAQAIINSITAGMTPRSSTLFHRILNKDLRMGMGVKSINKAFPINSHS